MKNFHFIGSNDVNEVNHIKARRIFMVKVQVRKFILWTVVIGLFGISEVCCQSTDELWVEAIQYYEGEQFREALKLLDRYIQLDDQNPEAFKIRGNCNQALNQLENAILDYKQSIFLDTTHHEAIYNIGITWEYSQKYDSAIYYFRKYVAAQPEDPDGFLSLGLNLQYLGKEDSMRWYFEKAYQLDSANMVTLNYLVQQYFYEDNFNKTIKLSNRGKKLEPYNVDFYILSGTSFLYQQKFNEAIAQADSALLVDSLNFDAFILSLESRILKKTQVDEIYLDSLNEFKFKKYTSNNLDQILAEDFTTGYEDLKQTVIDGEILGLNEYFQFYFAQHYQDDYSPYAAAINPKIPELFYNQNFSELAGYADEVFKTNPIKLDEIYKVAVANYQQGNIVTFRKLYTAYFGLIESIYATGSGLNADSAFIVLSTSDEYAVLNYSGFTSKGQSLVHEDGHSFDILRAVDNEENEYELFFNVDIPLRSLGKNSQPSNNSKKKKRGDKG